MVLGGIEKNNTVFLERGRPSGFTLSMWPRLVATTSLNTRARRNAVLCLDSEGVEYQPHCLISFHLRFNFKIYFGKDKGNLYFKFWLWSFVKRSFWSSLLDMDLVEVLLITVLSWNYMHLHVNCPVLSYSIRIRKAFFKNSVNIQMCK